MTKKRRMPVNVLAGPSTGETGDALLDGLMGGTEPPAPDGAERGTEAPLIQAARTPAGPARRSDEWKEARRLRRAEEIVEARRTWSLAVGLIPFWPVSLAALVALHAEMFRTLASEYEAPRRDLPRALGASFIAAVAAVAVGRAVGAVLGFLPVIGYVVGGSVAAAAATHVVGKTFVLHFEAGSTLLGLSPRAMRDYFRRLWTGPAERA